VKKFWVLLLFVLVSMACAIPVTGGGQTPTTPVLGTSALTATPDATGTPPPAATFTPSATMTAAPTLTRAATQTTAPTRTHTAPASASPFVVMRGQVEVRTGPGMNYELSHTLSQGTTAPVQGKSVDEQWWAIPGPGDGPGPLGWVHTSNVDFTGSAGTVPVLPPPSGGQQFPVHMDPGSPPSNACVAEPLVIDPATAWIRLGPGVQFNVIARLGNWAEVIRTEAGWHMLLLGPGDHGWINAQEVRLIGNCTN
jgi:SH3-like domain-containing protein